MARRATQEHLPDVPAPAVLPPVRKAAERYVEARDEWMSKSGPVKDAKEKLIAEMKKHGVQQYDEDDLHVTLKPGKDSVKVTLGDEEDED